MIAISLQSGSNGNCIYVASDGCGLLFDAGISGIQAQHRLAMYGIDIHRVKGVILSHDHSDHSRCAGVFNRKFGLPVFATKRTLLHATERHSLGKFQNIAHFIAGETLRFGNMSVQTVPTPHDGVDGVAFVVCKAQKRLGILTDLGHVFKGLSDVIASLDGVFLESNYDAKMLAEGPYPWSLQQRIKGPGGHISNVESAQLLADCASDRLKWACLAHLSEENNLPQLALAAHRSMVSEKLPLHVASRYEPSKVFNV